MKSASLNILFLILLHVGCAEKGDLGFTNSIGMKMIRIKAGSFDMGDVSGQWDERPVHRVTINQPFFISGAEITTEQYKKFRPEFTGADAFAPYASGINWYNAIAFCQWLSDKEGKSYRLPTEAEWY